MTALWWMNKKQGLDSRLWIFFIFCEWAKGSSIYRYKGFGDCNLWQTSPHKAVYCQAYCPSVTSRWSWWHSTDTIGKMLLTRPIANNVPTRASLTVKTKGLLFPWLAHLENKSNVCKHISSLFLQIPVTGQVSQKSSGPKSCWPKSCCLESHCSKPRIMLH